MATYIFWFGHFLVFLFVEPCFLGIFQLGGLGWGLSGEGGAGAASHWLGRAASIFTLNEIPWTARKCPLLKVFTPQKLAKCYKSGLFCFCSQRVGHEIPASITTVWWPYAPPDRGSVRAAMNVFSLSLVGAMQNLPSLAEKSLGVTEG